MTCSDAPYTLQLDRKSTRLNSSHLVISYAGFCLKKSKNIGITPRIVIDAPFPEHALISWFPAKETVSLWQLPCRQRLRIHHAVVSFFLVYLQQRGGDRVEFVIVEGL